MRYSIVVLSLFLLALAPVAARGQDDQAATEQQAETKAAKPEPNPRFTRALTNVQIELTLSDQVGQGAPEKKTVSMIVASGSWGKIRNSAARSGPFQNGLNVDARPFVSVDGPIQLELTLYYYPPQGKAETPVLNTELNQSLTVALQSGKPLLISQSADPASDRKVSVEVIATILK